MSAEAARSEIIQTVTGLWIRPENVDRVDWKLDNSNRSWEYWEFQLLNADGSLHSQWTRDRQSVVVNSGDPNSGIGIVTYSTFDLEIEPPFSDRTFTFQARPIASWGPMTYWESPSGTIPPAPSAGTAEYLPDPPRLQADWQWSDSQQPGGATVSFGLRYNPDAEVEFAPGDQRQFTLDLPAATGNTSQYRFAMETMYATTSGPTNVTSSSAWVPEGGSKVIVAAPEEVLADYDAVENEVRVYWTQPTPYGVDGYDIQYAVAGGQSQQTSVAGAETNQLSVPAGDIPGFDPNEQTDLTGRVRATGLTAGFVAQGPWSTEAALQYPEEAEAVIIHVWAAIDSFHGWLEVEDEWLNAENATRYTMYVAELTANGPTGHESFVKEWENSETVKGQVTYNHFDPTKTYGTSVTAWVGSHESTPDPWIPIITAIPQNIQFYYVYRPQSNDIYLYAEWDPIPDGAETVYDILLTVSGHDPIEVTTQPNQTTYGSTGPAEPGVAYTIQIRAQDRYTVPDSVDRTSAQSAPPRTAKGADRADYQVIRYGPWSAVVPAGTGGMLSRTYVYDSAGRLGRATTGTRTNQYTYDVRDNLIRVTEQS